jgi:GntR family transcriptional regulator
VQFAINTSDPRPIYVQIMDEVRRALVVGTLAAEDPLPSVRQLAADLRLNPNTVAQAYRELERDGVVYVRRGQGTFVAERASATDERRSLARDVAGRALLDAHRHGIGAEELIEAIRQTAAPHPTPLKVASE